MTTKTEEIGLWVSKEGILVKKPLAEILIDEDRERLSVLDYKTIVDHWNELRVSFNPSTLIKTYFDIVEDLDRDFREIARKKGIPDLYDKIIKEAKITFANKSAFEEKLKKLKIYTEGSPIYSSAYYNIKEGIVLSLTQDNTTSFVRSVLEHELGHNLDYLLNPKTYKIKDDVMHDIKKSLSDFFTVFFNK